MPSLEWTGVDVVLETEGYGDEEEVEDEHGEPHGLKGKGGRGHTYMTSASPLTYKVTNLLGKTSR